MATPAANQARPGVIRVDPLAGRNAWGEVVRVIPAWIISAGLHGILFLLGWLVFSDSRVKADEKQFVAPKDTIQTRIEAPEEKQPELTNEDEGIDPEVPAGFDVNRIAEVNVPGPVDPMAAIGVAGMPEGPPVNIPPPPGQGRGQGGTPDIPGVEGGGLNVDIKGGYAGVGRLSPGGFSQGTRGSGATRERMVQEGGGSAASEAAVARGLKWLALHQGPGGNWSLDKYMTHARVSLDSNRFFNDNSTGTGANNDTAATAFGLLPFFGAGITHKPTGKPKDDQYVKTVQRGMNFLLNSQNRDGSFPGGMYAHGLATIAVCECYGLTADPKLKVPAQAAIRYIVSAQDPVGGGWRYQPRAGGDTSVVGWQVMALKSAQMSGLNVPPITLKLAEKWVDSCESSDGGFGYVGPQATPTMTAVGVLCRMYLGTPRRNPMLRRGVDYLKNTPPGSGAGMYYNYYATQVFHHMGGDYWDFWNKGPKGKNGMRDVLLGRQEKNGSWAGSQGGRIMGTSLSLLTLEVYYRHLPLYQRVDTKK
jgi:hypothetical protein